MAEIKTTINIGAKYKLKKEITNSPLAMFFTGINQFKDCVFVVTDAKNRKVSIVPEEIKDDAEPIAIDEFSFAMGFEPYVEEDNSDDCKCNDKCDGQCCNCAEAVEINETFKSVSLDVDAMCNSVDENELKTIQNMLIDCEVKVATVFDKVTVVSCKLTNGFVITESSASASPDDYNVNIGFDICMHKIIEKMFELKAFYSLESKPVTPSENAVNTSDSKDDIKDAKAKSMNIGGVEVRVVDARKMSPNDIVNYLKKIVDEGDDDNGKRSCND